MKFLFVGGLARSGTSALCEMLNGHSQISIGMERYKYLATSGKLFDLGADVFTREKFFDWSEQETNIPVETGKYAELYSSLSAKYDSTVYKGDKLPGYYRMVGKLLNTFPDTKIVLIWRPLLEVAMSWHRRSIDNSSWPAENDAYAAIRRAKNDVKKIINAAEKYPENVRVVGYEEMFNTNSESVNRLIEWLDLDARDEQFSTSKKMIQEKSISLSASRESVRPELESVFYSDNELVAAGEKIRKMQI